jgi:O-acetylserine/cysteine efflux transporter
MRPRDMVLAVLAVSLWGGNYVAAKLALAHFPPLFLTAIRFLVSSSLLLPFVRFPTAKDFPHIFRLSVVLGVMHFSLMFGSLYQGLSVLTTVLVAQLGTPFACLLGWLYFGDRLGVRSICGLALAFLGVAVIAGTPDVASHLAGFLMALAAGFAWAFSNIILKRIEEKNIFVILCWMGVFAVPQLLILSGLLESGQWRALIHPQVTPLVALAYTVGCSTFVAYGLWYHLMGKYTVSQVVPFALLTPASGIALAQVYFSETIGPRTIAGGLLTLAGVAIVTFRRARYVTPAD